MTQNLNKFQNFKTNEKSIYYFLIAIFSFAVNFFYGYRGIFPIDSFLIYDSGFKILNGFHPFKDYWSITGPFLDYTQYLFFSIFDVNWFSYVLHSTIINSLLSIFIYYFFYKIGLNYFLSFLYSLGISLLAYPSAGTPFMDHHAVIFSLISICFLTLAILYEKKIYWFLFPFFLIFSFFSKQIPSAYLSLAILLILLFHFFYIQKRKYRNFFVLLMGSFVSIIFIYFIFIVNKIPINNFLIQYIFYPLSLGNERIQDLSLDIDNTIGQFKFIFLSLIPLGIISIIVGIKKFKNINEKKDFIILILILVTSLIFIYSQLLTKNQVLIFFLIPFYLGTSNLYLKKYLNKKIFTWLIICIFLFSTTKYHLRFNHNKKFMELANVDFKLSVDAKSLDKRFKGLNWITLNYPNNPQAEIDMLNDIKEIINSDSENKIIITDYQFLPSLIENSNINPNKWYDDLSVPSKNNKYFDNYKNFYLNSLKRQNISHIYIIEKNKTKYIDPLFKKDESCLKREFINENLIKLKINNCDF